MAVSAGFTGPKLENLVPWDSPACSPSMSFAPAGSLKRMGRERRTGGGVRCEVRTAKEDPRLMELSGVSALEQLKASALDSESPLRSRFLGSIDSCLLALLMEYSFDSCAWEGRILNSVALRGN